MMYWITDNNTSTLATFVMLPRFASMNNPPWLYSPQRIYTHEIQMKVNKKKYKGLNRITKIG